MRTLARFLFIFIMLAAALTAGEITFDDLYGVPGYGDPQISPDASKIVFGLRLRDTDKNTSSQHLWIMKVDGSDMRQLTDGDFSEWHPRWAPDGESVFFLSRRDGASQVWQIALEGDSADRMTEVYNGVDEFELFAGGERMIFVSQTFPDCHDDNCNRKRDERLDECPVKARLYDHLLYRHYNSWDDGRVSRLYTCRIDGEDVREVYSGPHNAPTAYLGGDRDYAVSPETDEVCFAMTVDTMPAVWPNNDLYTTSMAGDDPVILIRNAGLDATPRYSPNGRYLAYQATSEPGYESDQRDLVLHDRQTKQNIMLTGGLDLSAGGPIWSADSRWIYFTALEHGLINVYRVSVETPRRIEILLAGAVYGSLRVSPSNDYLLVTRSRSDEPYEICLFDLDSRTLTQLTDRAVKSVRNLDLYRADSFWFEGFNGDSVHGWLTLPPKFDSSKSYPLVLLIHGGPQWCWLGDFNYYGWNTQLVAAQGYVVAQIDPHGSAGYGLDFKRYVSGNWGRGDYEDLMLGVDYLIAEHAFIDSTRMAALGRSYGGFMTNWICGHTDRFRCLVSIDGTVNHISGYGSTEELWFPEWEYNGTPWSNREEYVRSSPLTYAENFKTPMMLIHGEYDYRVDLSEGLQMFTALQRMGVESQLVYLPDEGHNAHKPENIRYLYEKQFEWLARWLR